jgi:hypothetical protein
VAVLTSVAVLLTGFTTATKAHKPPPAGGYFSLVPVGQFSSLPSDAQAAALVHKSPWEPRPRNKTANHTVPPASFKTPGYSGMLNHDLVFGRVTGNYTGTTDQIIQWAAIKWGLPDEILRAVAVDESWWTQKGFLTSTGFPKVGSGFGDFGACGGSPAPSGYGSKGPASFGIMQGKWCSLQDPGVPAYGGWPWTQKSTAYSLDLFGAVMRGCYEGWDTWLGPTYQAGDLWGCLGRWNSGAWYDAKSMSYISRVKGFLSQKKWRTWKG